jgi:hypothetical protein
MLLKRKSSESEIKSKGSFGRGWTTLPREGDGVDVHLIEATLTKEIRESKAQEVA